MVKEQNRRIYKFDEFQIDVPNRQLRRGDKPVIMPAKAFDLLLALVENKGRLIEKDELFSRVWNDRIVEESNLTVHISQIRKALGEKRQNTRYIETVPGYGYRFVGAIENFDDDDLIIETQTLSRIVIEKEENEATQARRHGKTASNETQILENKSSSLPNVSAPLRRRVSASKLAKKEFQAKITRTLSRRMLRLSCGRPTARRLPASFIILKRKRVVLQLSASTPVTAAKSS